MNGTSVRGLLIECLEAANVITMRDKDRIPAFLNDADDVLLEDLDMDSLNMMELCIAIEVNIGASIVPDELSHVDTLNRLAALIESRLK